jgi:hypothetical protein
MQIQSFQIHAHAVPHKGDVTLTIEFGSGAAATLTLRPNRFEHLTTLIDQALGTDEDDDTIERPVIDADG